MAHTTGKTMKTLETFYLVKIGMQFCDQKILPLMIARVEPKEDSVIRHPVFTAAKIKNTLRKPNTVVTFMEAEGIIGRYQIRFLLVLYCAIPILGVLGYVVSHILEFINSLIKIPNWVESTIYSLLLIAFISFWAGVLVSIKKRTKIWEEARDNELEIRKLEHFAMNKSSKIMARILFEIGKLKDEHKEEVERVNKIRKKRSVLDVETMKIFNEMMDERAREIKRKGNITTLVLTVVLSVASWYFNASITYALEKVYDYILYGIKPIFGSTNK